MLVDMLNKLLSIVLSHRSVEFQLVKTLLSVYIVVG